MNKKPKIILFDVDGVLIRPPHYFGLVLEKKGYPNAHSLLNEFYAKNYGKQCAIGEMDILKKIKPFLEKFNWTGTVREFLNEQFTFESKYLDQKFLDLIKNFRKKGLYICLATDQEKERAKFLLEELDWQKIFNDAFISCHIGARKCVPEFWEYVLEKLQNKFSNLEPSEILFFDDKQENIDQARAFKINAHLFTTKEKFTNEIKIIN